MTVHIDDRPHPGPPRRRLTEDDRELAEDVAAAAEEVEAATQALDVAYRHRWRAVSAAFDAGIHPLDVVRLARVERRTVRDWHAKWAADQA